MKDCRDNEFNGVTVGDFYIDKKGKIFLLHKTKDGNYEKRRIQNISK